MIDVDAALAYVSFVEARHQAWEARQRGLPQPWTEDPIVNSRKFTNVFRVLDPGSQFVFELEDDGPTSTLVRLFLYRHTNLPSAWRAFAAEYGEWPSWHNLDEVKSFWQAYRAEGGKVFSGAYMVYPQSSVAGTDKVDSVIETTKRLLDEGVFEEFTELATTQADRFAVLRRNKGVADFMSMQILTDYGYTRHAEADLEDEFVVAGPGAKRGAAHLAPGLSVPEAMVWARDAVHASDGCPLLWHNDEVFAPRKPSMMDIQNTLCEFSKYVRYMSSPAREQLYRPAHPGVQSSPVLPKHWN